MKVFKKIMALAIAMVMVLGLALPAMAAPENKTLKVPNETGHTYEVFQIFTGDLAEGKLSNVTWGVNGKGEGLVDKTVLDALAAVETSTADPAKVDAILSALGMAKSDLNDGNAFKKDVAAGTELSVPTGYYIVKDKDASQDKEGGEYSLLMIDVVGDVTLSAKMDTPEVNKKVDDKNDSDPTSKDAQLNGSLQDSADYDIGDKVPYTLTATLADNVSAYKKYHITFVDKLESGKFSEISALTIKVDGIAVGDVSGYNASVSGYDGDVPPSVDGFTQTIEFTPKTGDAFLPDSLNGKKVTIEFTATLGTGATIGMPGNANTVKLEYSNNPNDDQGGEEGTTPVDKVIVFTYKLTVNKVEPDGEGTKAKTGADFTLYKEVPTAAEGETQIGTLGSTIKAGFDSSVKATALEDAKYYVVVGQKTGDVSGSQFSFNGVDDGNYVLVETTIPAGYNGWDAVAFTIAATHELEDVDPKLTSLTGGDLVDGEFKDTGIITTDILNQEGSTLPSTGGMGTTIFYVIGGILVLAAAIILISKRRVQQ